MTALKAINNAGNAVMMRPTQSAVFEVGADGVVMVFVD